MKENKITTPTILITGFPEKDKIIAAAQLGIQDVLVKPVHHQDLMAMIRQKLSATDAATNETENEDQEAKAS
jgi:DNA-binding response OmpR family regulator